MENSEKLKVKKKKIFKPRQYSKLIKPNDVISSVKTMSLLDVKERRIYDLEAELELAAKKEDRIYYEKEIKKSKVGLKRLRKSVDNLEKLVENGFRADTLESAYNQKVYMELLDYSESRTKIHEKYADEIKYWQDKMDDYERDLKSIKGVVFRQIKNLYVPATVGVAVTAGLKGIGVPDELAIAGGAASLIAVKIGKESVNLVQYIRKVPKMELKKIKQWKKEIEKLREREDFEKSLLYDRLVDNVTRKYISYKKDRTSEKEIITYVRKQRVIKKTEPHIYELEVIEEKPELKDCKDSFILKDADTIKVIKEYYEEPEHVISPAQTYKQESEKRQAFQAQQEVEFSDKKEIDYLKMD